MGRVRQDSDARESHGENTIRTHHRIHQAFCEGRKAHLVVLQNQVWKAMWCLEELAAGPYYSQ